MGNQLTKNKLSEGQVGRFEKKFQDTIKQYSLFSKKDKILVACSGGKDSTTALYLLHRLEYDVEALMIDLKMGDWSDRNLENLVAFCVKNGIKHNIINIREVFGCSICYMRSGIQAKKNLGNCTICGVVRRWLLNKKAREMGATKLVTGHNLDDEAENVMMNIFKGNPELFVNLGPRTGVIDDNMFVPRVKPLYFHTNKEIKEYTKKLGFKVVYSPCPCSKGAFRKVVRTLIAKIEKDSPDVKINLVNNFLEMLPAIRKKYSPGMKIIRCTQCGEPSRNPVCKRCEFFGLIGSS